MITKIFKIAGLLTVVFLFSFHKPNTDISRDKMMVKLVMQSLKSGHYRSLIIDDSFSQQVFDLYIKRLDQNKRYLTRGDIAELSLWRDKLDDQLKSSDYTFFDRSMEILHARQAKVEKLYQKILDKPFDFDKNETIELDFEKVDYVKDEDALRERWRLNLKHQTLNRLNIMMNNQEKVEQKQEPAVLVYDPKEENKDSVVELKSFEEMETESRKKIRKRMHDYFDRLSKLKREDWLAMYLNAVTNTYGPHTGFFLPRVKENFDISLSGRLEGIGAELTTKDEYIKVNKIVPGSACWREGRLKAGDLILKVGQGDEEPVDIVDWRIDDAVKIIRGKKGTEVRLTVKKLDGTVIEIPIIRDVVIISETYAKSVLIEEEGKAQKMGYIKLPKFYIDLNKKGARSCAKDMRAEIEKLKRENIEGLIVDLRNNGGGSLEDAVKIAGLFFNKGPVVQVKSRGRKPYIFEDKDAGTPYAGPLVIMVNSFSASASEILAAAMQDYERAVIIGTNGTTYGKGTVQRFYNLDQFLGADFAHIKPLGSVKMTVQKFYRINGGATQLKGVVPDLALPGNYNYIDMGEKELDHVMPWDEIDPLKYYRADNRVTSMESIIKGSAHRIKENKRFKMIDENAHRLKKQRNISNYSLNLNKFRAAHKRRKEEAQKFKDVTKITTKLEVISLPTDDLAMQGDSAKLESTKIWHKGLMKDIYLEEAVRVLQDLI